MSKPLWYIASPYSHPDPEIREQRFDAVCRECSLVLQSGIFVYSPIAHTHPIALAGSLPTDWEFWKEFDTKMIEACDMVCVLMLPGWKASKGVTAEIKIARGLGKQIIYRKPGV